MPVKIRPVILKDAPSLRTCVGVVAKERRYLSFFGPFPLSQVKKYLQRCLRAELPFFVAVDGGQVVGWADIVDSGGASAHVGTLGMGLLPDYRSKGLGKKLLSKVLKRVSTKFEQVELSVYRRNKAARSLYIAAGFKLCGAKKKAAKLAYGYEDVLYMQKFFSKK